MSLSPSRSPAPATSAFPSPATVSPPDSTPFITPLSAPVAPLFSPQRALPVPPPQVSSPPPTATSAPPVSSSLSPPLPVLPEAAPPPQVSSPPPTATSAPPVSSSLSPPLPVLPEAAPPPLHNAIPPATHVIISPSPILKSPPPPTTTTKPPTPPQLPITPLIPSTSPPPLPSPQLPVTPSTPSAFPPQSPVLPAISLTPPSVSSLPLETSPPPQASILLPPPPPWPTDSPPSPALVSPSPLPSSYTPIPKTPFFGASTTPSLPLATQSSTNTQQLRVPIGLLLACLVGGVILLLVLGVFCFRCKDKRKKRRLAQDYSEPPSWAPKKGVFLSKPSQENVCPPGAHVITALPEHLASLPLVGSYGSSCSGSVNLKTSQAAGAAPSFTRGSFTYDELVVATNGFSEANLLGEGGFGYVHRGILRSGKEVAVKQLKSGSHQGEQEFQAEVETISRIHHKHLVSLVGYCITGVERLLVYEFVPNNTLEFHLHGKGRPIMDWETRLRIAIGSAKGLAYLHEDCNPTIIHRDIKASNILLDSRFEAKVSDFGLAKMLSDNNTHVSTRVIGTFGYLAPEYASSGKLTDKSDVYSYGIVLLELITGRPPITAINSYLNESLVDWARPLLKKALEDGNFDALVDPKLDMNYKDNEMENMVACAAACVRHSAWLRPRMSQVIRALEGDVSFTKIVEDSAIYSSSGSSKYESHQYNEEMKKFNMSLWKECGISGYSESTGEYGLNPSGSSGYSSRQTEI